MHLKGKMREFTQNMAEATVGSLPLKRIFCGEVTTSPTQFSLQENVMDDVEAD